MERGFGAGISLVKLSLQFMREHYVLFVVNIMGGIPALIFARFFFPYALKHFLVHDAKYRLNMHVLGKGFILLAIAYLILNFCSWFVKTAMTSYVLDHLKGQKTTWKDSWDTAQALIPDIFFWSLVDSLVQPMMAIARGNNDHFIMKILTSIVDLAWTVGTQLVVPIILVEKRSATSAIKRSGQLFKEEWRETVTIKSLSSIFGIIFAVITVILVFGLINLLRHSRIEAATNLVLVWLLLVVAFASFSSTLSVILNATLYQYAIGGTLPPTYPRAFDDSNRNVTTRRAG